MKITVIFVKYLAKKITCYVFNCPKITLDNRVIHPLNVSTTREVTTRAFIHTFASIFLKLMANLAITLGLCLLLVLGMNTSFLANAQEMNISTNNPNDYPNIKLKDVGAGTLLFQQPGTKRYLQAPHLKTKVDININGIVANVKVIQTFTNTTDEWQHALYAFPLPDNAAVNQLKVTVADRIIIGEVQEKKQALKTFNKAKKNGQKAALVEQHRPNLFSTQVANIPPHESIEVALNYFQQIDYQSEEFSLHFPMAITPRYQPSRPNSHNSQINNSLPDLLYQARNAMNVPTGLAFQYGKHNDIDEDKSGETIQRASKPYLNDSTRQFIHQTSHNASNQVNNQLIDLSITLSAGAELAQIKSVNHALIAKQQANNDGEYTLKLINEPMVKDFKLTWKYSATALPQVLNFQQQYKDDRYGLLMVLPGLNEEKVTMSRELTFVLDTSGSMSGQSLEQAKRAFNFALKSLTKHDSFQVISFNSYPTKLFQAAVIANETNKQNAWQYVNQLTSTGGTEIQSALALILDEKQNNSEKLQQIVFLTDGAVGNESEIFSYIAKNISNKRLFTVGLGTAPNRYFMKKAAEIGRGSYQFISNHSELVKEMERLFTKLSNPVLTDLSLNLNDPNGVLDTTPNPIPDVYQNEPLFLSYQIANSSDKGQPTDGLLTGIYKGNLWSLPIEGYENQYNGVMTNQEELMKPAFESNIPALATLWARRKVADHYRQLMLYKNTESKANIIDLALNFQLVTPFTSLVAVEKKVSRPHYLTAKAKQLRNNLPSGQKLPSTSLNWQWQFYLSLCLLGVSALLMILIVVREKITQHEKLFYYDQSK